MAHRSFFGITHEVGEELLTCPICCEKYDGSAKIAKFLPCFHTFCVRCLGLHSKDQLGFKCPLCRRNTEVPAGGVERFTDNFIVTKLKDLEHLINADVNKPSGLSCGACKEPGPAVGFCRHVDCSVFLCQHCDDSHKRMLVFYESHCTVSIEQLQQGPGIQLPLQKTNCDIHKSKPLELFCNEELCQIPMCLLCATTSHQGHSNVVLDQKSSEVKEELKSLAEAAKQKITPVKEISEKIGSEIDSTNRRIDEVSSSVTKIFNGIHEMLNARKEKIVAELEQIRSEQTSCLQRQSDRAQSQASQLESAYQFAERARDIGNPVDLLQTKKEVISSLHELIGRDFDTLLPSGSSDEAYVAVEENDECLLEIKTLISRLGNIQTHCVTEGANITWNVTFPGQDVSCLPVKVPRTVQIRCDHTAVVDLDRLSGRFNVVLIAPDKSSTECVDYYIAENCLELRYCFQPLVTGTHQLSISLSGVPISGSPFGLTVVESSAEDSSSNCVKTQVPPSETTSYDVTWSDAFARCKHTIFLKLHGAPRFIPSAENITAKYTVSDSTYQSKIGNTETGDARTAKANEVTAEIEETGKGNTLKIVYTPEKAGQVNMTIFADGAPIAGSPFVININPLHPHSTTVSEERMGACPPNTAVLDMPYHLDVVTYDYRGERLTTGGYNITAVSIPVTLETPQECAVTDNQNGSYRITCTPRLRKTHTVSIKICGFPVHLKKPLAFFVKESLTFQDPPGGYKSPSSLTFDKERETIYVADSKKGAIISFSSDGCFVKSLQFENMRKSALIAVDAVDKMVALIPDYKRISTFRIGTELEEGYSWTCNGIQKATSLALSPSGHVVVGDGKLQALFIYDLESGELTRKIPLLNGSLASGMSNVCIDSKDEILVARHSEPYQLLRYSLEGNELSSLSSPAKSNQLAVAITSKGHVIVATVDAILVMEGDTLGIIKAIPTGGQIYTGITVTNDECFVGFEPGLKHLAKYSYNME